MSGRLDPETDSSLLSDIHGGLGDAILVVAVDVLGS